MPNSRVRTPRRQSRRAPLTGALASVRRSALRLAMSRPFSSRAPGGGSGGIDLSTIKKFPRHTHYPLQRIALDPVPRLRQARADGEVTKLARLLGLNIWLVTGDRAARHVMSDAGAFSNDLRHLMGTRKRNDAEQVGGLGMTDAPEHTRLRKMLTPEFTKRRLARLQTSIDEVVAESLDAMEADGPVVDLVESFGFQIPFRVICDLLGMPEVDRAAFRSLGSARFDLSEGSAGSFGAAVTSRSFLIDLTTRLRDAERGGNEGLIAALLDKHGADFDDVELGGMADGVFLGGYETSASMLSLGTFALLSNPEYFRLLREGIDEDVDAIVEELLRYVCPVQLAFPRFARHDMDLYGHRVVQGDVVLLSLSGANRDPQAHPAADAFDPTQPGAGHLSFGHGLHRCVGAELARMELRTALRGLATRFPELSLACEPDELEFTELSAVYSVARLPVRLGTPQRPAPAA